MHVSVSVQKEPEDPMTLEPVLHQYTSSRVIDLQLECQQQFQVHIVTGGPEPRLAETENAVN